MLLKDLGRLPTGKGVVAVCRVVNPLLDPARWTWAYAAVVVEPSPSFSGPPVTMLLTVNNPCCASDDIRDLGIGDWSGRDKQVENVYALRGFRGGLHGDTAPVLVGRFLYSIGEFECHSPHRTDAGDKWARAVGGFVPERTSTNAGVVAAHLATGLQVLAEDPWWRQLRLTTSDG